jgi:hypothetical protein
MQPTADTKPQSDPAIKEYADGWITERNGTDVPGFLKLAFIVIPIGAAAYFLLYMYGETTHSERGPLVQAMNAATQASAGLMYAIAAMIVVFGLIVIAFSFRKPH